MLNKSVLVLEYGVSIRIGNIRLLSSSLLKVLLLLDHKLLERFCTFGRARRRRGFHNLDYRLIVGSPRRFDPLFRFVSRAAER